MNLTYHFVTYALYLSAVAMIRDELFDDVCVFDEDGLTITTSSQLAYNAIGNILAGIDLDDKGNEAVPAFMD